MAGTVSYGVYPSTTSKTIYGFNPMQFSLLCAYYQPTSVTTQGVLLNMGRSNANTYDQLTWKQDTTFW